MHDLLFDDQSHPKPKNLRGYAERLELELLRYDADVQDELYLQRVRATPTFFINGRVHDVFYGVERLMEGIEAALRK